jgi:hypothetical protein
VGNTPVAFPMPEGNEGPVVREHVVAGDPVVAFFEHGTIEAETDHDLASARRGWSGSVWRTQIDGRQLTSFWFSWAHFFPDTQVLGIAQ